METNKGRNNANSIVTGDRGETRRDALGNMPVDVRTTDERNTDLTSLKRNEGTSTKDDGAKKVGTNERHDGWTHGVLAGVKKGLAAAGLYAAAGALQAIGIVTEAVGAGVALVGTGAGIVISIVGNVAVLATAGPGTLLLAAGAAAYHKANELRAGHRARDNAAAVGLYAATVVSGAAGAVLTGIGIGVGLVAGVATLVLSGGLGLLGGITFATGEWLREAGDRAHADGKALYAESAGAQASIHEVHAEPVGG